MVKAHPIDRLEVYDAMYAAHQWLIKLSPKKIEAFKKSEDFKVYSNFLKKYGFGKEVSNELSY